MTEPIQNAAPADPAAQTQTDDEFGRLLKGNFRPDGAFQTPDQFKHAQRISKLLVASPMVPEHFRGDKNLPNMVIAVDMALRLKLNPLLVASQIYMVHGKPGWSAQFMIAAINISGKFDRLKFRVTGEGDQQACIAYAKDLSNGDVLEGSPVSIDMAKKEGWFDKNGSKWKTLPDLMLRYRAAAFWSRLNAPELTMGLATVEELEDVGAAAPKVEKPIFKTAAPTEPSAGLQAEANDIDRQRCLFVIRTDVAAAGIAEADLIGALNQIGLVGDGVSLDHLKIESLTSIQANLPDLITRIKEVAK